MTAPEGSAQRYVHLPALLLGWSIVILGLLAVWMRAHQLERSAVLGELVLPRSEANRGLAIQRTVLRRSDVHLLFGSSEIVRQSPFRAMEFFHSSPTGFRIVGVGDRGTPLVVTAYNLAALGGSLRNRTVVVSVSHNFFQSDRDPESELATYLGTFSLLHASQITFGGALPPGVRRRVAQRLLQQPAALRREPLMRAALRWGADSSATANLAFAALAPMGVAQRAVLEFQDHLRVALALSNASRPPPGSPVDVPIDWEALSDSAEHMYRRMASNNPFGMIDQWWVEFGEYLLGRAGSRADAEWRSSVANASAWEDLALLLDIAAGSGARVLLLSMPYKGVYRDFEGTTQAGRRVYYDSLRAHAARAGVVLRDFAQFEGDRWFMRDQSAHPSPKGWVHYDQAIDEFVSATAQ
jgi:D-alanine transfer protein